MIATGDKPTQTLSSLWLQGRGRHEWSTYFVRVYALGGTVLYLQKVFPPVVPVVQLFKASQFFVHLKRLCLQ